MANPRRGTKLSRRRRAKGPKRLLAGDEKPVAVAEAALDPAGADPAVAGADMDARQTQVTDAVTPERLGRRGINPPRPLAVLTLPPELVTARDNLGSEMKRIRPPIGAKVLLGETLVHGGPVREGFPLEPGNVVCLGGVEFRPLLVIRKPAQRQVNGARETSEQLLQPIRIFPRNNWYDSQLNDL